MAIASNTGPYTLPPLAFDYDALEPVMDVATMRINHGKHHQAYVNSVNAALAEYATGSTLLIDGGEAASGGLA
jgi:Fe-Mn family superoxide dismutase